MDEPALTFAGLLRQLRAEARLTQEELAEAAGVSPRSVSDLERGINRTARKDTAVLIAGGLGLPGTVAELFVAAARGRGGADEVVAARQEKALGAFAAAATRGLPRDVASFTGRRAELDQLTQALDSLATGGGVVGICAIGGMAGIGKTTFAVHAAHRLAASFPDGQFYLPLHAHTPGQQPVGPADALSSLLLTAGVPAARIPPGLEARAARWRDHVAGKKILLLLDDAAGHEQVRPLLPGAGGSLVLLTSRRRLTALNDAAVISLGTLAPPEAAALLIGLAGRPGFRPGDAAVAEITRLCGYLPLAIGLIASQLRHHPAQTAESVAASLAEATDRMELMRAENLSVAAAFDLSYTDLTDGQQRLFRRLGLIPGPSFDACAVAALDGTSPGKARLHLDELYDQHLITEPGPGRYELHDLLREHARVMAAGTGAAADSEAATERLLDYYLHTAQAAGQYFVIRASTYRRPRPDSPPPQTPDLSTLGQAAAWLEAERANLQAAADYAAARGRFRHAIAIPAAMSGFLAARGHWNQSAALHQSALAAARQAEDQPGEAIALATLGGLQRETADYPAATLARALALYGDIGDQPGQADVLNELGYLRTLIGDYPAAVRCHEQALALFRDLDDQHGQAWTLSPLALVQHLTGDYRAASAGLRQALALFRDLGHLLGQAEALNRLGELSLRISAHAQSRDQHTQALAIAREISAVPEEARALEGIGNGHLADGNAGEAAAYLRQALTINERIGAAATERIQETLRKPSLSHSTNDPARSSPS